MSDSRVVVCERRNAWAVALRRALADTETRVVETRTLDDCRREVQADPWTLVVCEAVEENLGALVQWLVERQMESNAAPVVVVGDRRLRKFAPAFREAGAVHVVFSPRQLENVANMAARHTERRPNEQSSSLRQLAWSRLPWDT